MSLRGEHLHNRSQSFSTRTGAHQHHGFQSAGSILRGLPGDLVVSKQKLRRAEAIACVRLKRQEANQNLGFTSRPFVLCGLPIKKPAAGQLLHERRNGQFSLQVVTRRMVSRGDKTG
ncbi:MAG: plasmid encoded RepA protein [Candidatus Sulfotelmatobacter sp.]|nr:plasmid encoded RepA protein [Candidatus Sulfotelmatobacter sp.]